MNSNEVEQFLKKHLVKGTHSFKRYDSLKAAIIGSLHYHVAIHHETNTFYIRGKAAVKFGN